MTTNLRLATRGSPLALWQADHVAAALRLVVPDLIVEQIRIETTGDQLRDQPLSEIGGEGLFTKQIQRAVLEDRADVAVHSLKDLPTAAVDGLILAAVPERGPVGDALVSRRHCSFDALPLGALIGTSSLRRRAQLLHRRPDLRFVDMRGNIDTRLRKLEDQNLDALVLAQAGLERLGLQSAVTETLDTQWMLPAVGQGALALECRRMDAATITLLAKIDHAPTAAAVRAERSMLHALGGGCQVPLGAVTCVAGQRMTMRGAVLTPDGSRRIADEVEGTVTHSEAVGLQLADALLRRGAKELLQSQEVHS